MIRAWPTAARHCVVAPSYPATKPTLRPAFERQVDGGNVTEVPRNVQAVPPIYVADMHEAMKRVLRGQKPEVAINYNFADIVWNAQAIRRLGYKGRILCHVGTMLENAPVVLGALHSTHCWGVHFVPASEVVRQRALALASTADAKARVGETVWNGVELARFDVPFRAIAQGTPLICGFTGRMAYPAVKDWDWLFATFSAARDTFPALDLRLRIAGDGPMRERLAAIAPAKTYFVGNVSPEGMPLFLSGLNVFLMAALPIEGMSMALCEAVAARCDVVSTSVPSTAELLGQDEHGQAREFPTQLVHFIATALGPSGLDSDRAALTHIREKLDAKRMAAAYQARGSETAV
jgi:glycosyltransferase involved in cell wall biosynthesis